MSGGSFTCVSPLLALPPELRPLSDQLWHRIHIGARALTFKSRQHILRLPQKRKNGTVVVMHLDHPETTPPALPPIYGKTVFHEIDLCCQKVLGTAAWASQGVWAGTAGESVFKRASWMASTFCREEGRGEEGKTRLPEAWGLAEARRSHPAREGCGDSLLLTSPLGIRGGVGRMGMSDPQVRSGGQILPPGRGHRILH